MGTFAETTIIDYCSSFAYRGKQTSVIHSRCSKQMEFFRFRLVQTYENCRFPLVLFFVCLEGCVWGVCVGCAWGGACGYVCGVVSIIFTVY
jgi:hypothetical protein